MAVISTWVDGLECRLDCSDSSGQTSRFNEKELKAEVPIGLFMDLLKTQSLLEADPARFGRHDRAQVSNKENLRLIDRLIPDVLQRARKFVGDRVPEVDRQSSGADR